MLAGSTLIYRKLSSPPQALRLRARLDTNGEKKKKKKKIGAEFMTSVSYRPEVINKLKNIQIQINLYVVIICLTIGVLLLYDILV